MTQAPVSAPVGGPLDLPVQISSGRQLSALTSRALGSVIRNGEVIFAIIAPVFLAVCFYLPLRSIMNAYPGMNYAQYLMPIIALQSVGFVASAAAMRASLDGQQGINTRFRVLPMHPAIPILARTAANTALLAVSLVCATIASLAIGWRPHGGFLGTVGLYAVAVTVGVLVAVIADALGLIAKGPEATSQLLGLPILILGMVSTGFVPASQFPDWIRPFARNQPVSQFTDAMRAFNDGSATWSVVAPTVYWCVGMAALAAALMWLAERRWGR